jgi:hypothetical protein
MQLLDLDYPIAYPGDLNNRGEIVGYVSPSDWSTGFSALWKPAKSSRSAYNLTRLTNMIDSQQVWAEANGINDLGDIVGDYWDDNGYGADHAARWSTRDPNFIESLGFPGTWSWATKVNNNRIAVGSYSSDTIVENTVVVKLP